MDSLSKLGSKEVLLVTGDEADGLSDLFVTSNQADLKKHMDNLIMGEEIRVLHGLITSAKILPPVFNKLSAYIIYQNPKDFGTGYVYESSATNSEELSNDVLEILGSEAVASDIEDLYIMYGCEIQPRYYIEPEDIDEAIINRCAKIYVQVKKAKDQLEME
jgi:hypothetical protein